MSAFTVGSQTNLKDPAAGTTASRKPADEGLGKAFVKWIPGDAIVFYTALLTAGASQTKLPSDATPEQVLEHIDASSPGWFLFALAAALLFVIVGAVIPSGPSVATRPSFGSLAVRMILTVVAFIIWSSLLPGSYTSGWHLVRDAGPAYVLVVTVLGALFTAVAQELTKRTNS